MSVLYSGVHTYRVHATMDWDATKIRAISRNDSCSESRLILPLNIRALVEAGAYTGQYRI